MMETSSSPNLTDLLDTLAAQGYERSFSAEGDGLRAAPGAPKLSPDEVVVDGVHRVEVNSSPDEQVIVFALRNPATDERGVYVAPHGPATDDDSARMVERLHQRAASHDDEDRGFRVSDRRWWVEGVAGEPTAEPAEAKPSYVVQLEKDLAERDQRLQETLARYREAQAEFERAKQRIERESKREQTRARLDFMKDFLELLDDVDRAVEAAQASSDVEALRDGIELVHRRFLATLRSQGVARIKPDGARFDPTLHEAVSAVPVTSEEDDGRVVGVIAPGYTVGEEVLRPARVAVGKRQGQPVAPTS